MLKQPLSFFPQLAIGPQFFTRSGTTVQRVVSRKEKRAAIREYVHKQRRAMDICSNDLACGSVPEGSCQDGREWLNLVGRQLVFTREPFGDWQLLRDPEILEAAYRYVTEGKRG